jgi:adenine-specific DNA-methyltransferase
MKPKKLAMRTPSLADENFAALAALFPNAVTETTDENGAVVRAIDKDVLAQEINAHVVEGREERYQFTWPDKRKSVLLANAPIAAALRPCREESVDFDNTENLYIEGDNLDVLKLLRETYLNRVKMIYIDPPYNTGSDFIYNDDFSESADTFFSRDGQYDDDGNRLVKNLDGNGRFHTDWLNMLYPRLRLSKDLLSDDGVIFISIDENEVQNLRKMCDEIFGEGNFVSQLGWQKVYSPKNQAQYFSNDYEFVLCYARNISSFSLNDLPRTAEMNARYKNPDNDPRGDWKAGDCVGSGERKNGHYDVISPITGKTFDVPQGKHWVYAPDTMQTLIADNRIYFGKDGNSIPSVKQFLSEMGGRKASSLLMHSEYGHTDMAKKDLIKLFSELEKAPFPTPKPIKLIKMLAMLGSNDGDIILDFFAGSATTAQSIFELNAEQSTKRHFILVQTGTELLDDNPGAATIGLHSISDVSKERIRRAGAKIKADSPLTAGGLDVGFRVLKLDSSNMKDVYYTPEEFLTMADKQRTLFGFMDNIKDDRSPEDLLFQVMLDLGVPLSAKIAQDGDVYYVNDTYLVARFKPVDTALITEIAQKKPYYAVFRDSSFASDSAMVNFEQVFNTYSPNTIRRVL